MVGTSLFVDVSVGDLLWGYEASITSIFKERVSREFLPLDA
jgi:hypothetical protein